MKEKHYTTPTTESIRLCVEYQLCAGSENSGKAGDIQNGGGDETPSLPPGVIIPSAKSYDASTEDKNLWED